MKFVIKLHGKVNKSEKGIFQTKSESKSETKPFDIGRQLILTALTTQMILLDISSSPSEFTNDRKHMC
jgi:hypothetical protein